MLDGRQDFVDGVVVDGRLARDASPVGLVVEGVDGQEVALLAAEAQDGGHVGAELGDVTTTSTLAVEKPIASDVFSTTKVALNNTITSLVKECTTSLPKIRTLDIHSRAREEKKSSTHLDLNPRFKNCPINQQQLLPKLRTKNVKL